VHRRCDRAWKIRVFFPLLLRAISPPRRCIIRETVLLVVDVTVRFSDAARHVAAWQGKREDGKIRSPGHDSSTVHVPFRDRRMSIYRTRENGDRGLGRWNTYLGWNAVVS